MLILGRSWAVIEQRHACVYGQYPASDPGPVAPAGEGGGDPELPLAPAPATEGPACRAPQAVARSERQRSLKAVP